MPLAITLLAALALVLALAPLRIALALVALVAVAALAWVGPVWGVYLAILSVPVQQYVLLPGGTSLTQAAVLLMAGAWLLRLLAQPQQRLAGGPMLWAWLALLAALALSASLTPYDQGEALKATMRWGVAFLVWLVAASVVRERWQALGLLACLLAAPAAEALIGLFQFFAGYGPASFRIAASLPFVRAYGSIGQPNSFAGYMNMAWPLAVALAVGAVWRGRRTGLRLAPLAGLVGAAGVTGGALLASFSLGGWVGGLLGCVGLLATLGRRWAAGAFGAAGALVGFLALGGVRLLPDAVAGRMTRLTSMLNFFDPATVTVTPENFALVERMAQMKAGAQMFLAHPLTGVGPGNFTPAYSHVASAPWYVSRGHAHNFYLHMAAEAGALGAAAYLALLGASIWLAVRAMGRARGWLARSVAAGCCGIIAAVAGHNMFENLHVLNLGVQLSGVWAILAVLPRIEAPEPHDEGDERR
ncbi:O-antigen ligase family protein [Chloroflexia bacterium SDU3-3]|nr:O-antigen ligase family protein [Chloroflexia bacterium SDU3-3]